MITSDTLPTVPGPRIALRAMVPSDADALFAVFSDPEVTAYWSHAPWTSTDQALALIEDVRQRFVAGTLYQWGVDLDGSVIGHVTVIPMNPKQGRAEVGFSLARRVWGQGYASEAVHLGLTWAFANGIRRMEADVDPRNERSLALLERVGFEREGFCRERWIVDGVLQDSVLLGLLAKDYSGPSART